MYADDLIVWLMTLANTSNPQCPIYNVGSDKEVEIRDLANIVSDIFNVDVTCAVNTSISVDRYTPSTQKAKKTLNLKESYDLRRAISLSV